MLENDFDKNIKDNLESVRMDWDKDAMWQSIEPQLPKSRNRRPVILILFFFLSLVALFVKFFTFDKSTTNPERDVAHQDYRQVPAADLNNNEHSIQTADSGLLFSLQQPSTDSSRAPINNPSGLKQSGKSMNSKIITQDDKNGKPVLDIDNSGSPMASSIGQTALSFDNWRAKPLQDNKPADPIEGHVHGMPDVSHTVDFTESRVLSGVHDLPPLSMDCVSMEEHRMALPFGKSNAVVPKQVTVDQSRFPVLSANVYFLAGIPQRRSHSLNAEWLELRSESEKVLESTGLGMAVEFFLSDRIAIRTGIEWVRINEQMDYTEVIEEQVSITVDTAAYYYNFAGERKYITRKTDVTSRYQRENKLYNRLDSYHVPVNLMYRWKSRSWDFLVYSGPVISMGRTYRGALIQPDGQLDRSGHRTFGIEWLDSWDMGLSVRKVLSPSISLGGALNYRKSISDFSYDSRVFQSYDVPDIRVGLFINL